MWRYIFSKILVSFAVGLMPDLAMACSVCMSSLSKEESNAYFGATALLALLPMALIFYLFWKILRKYN